MDKTNPFHSGQCMGKPALGYLWAFAAVLLLHIVGGMFLSRFTWGFGYWGFFGSPMYLLIPIVLLICLLPPVLTRLTRGFTPAADLVSRAGRSLPPALIVVASSIVLFLVFYHFRSRALFYGDGYSVLNSLSAGTFSISAQFRLQALSVLVQHYAIASLRDVLPFSAEQIFAAVNCLGGVLGFWGIVRLSRAATSGAVTRWFLVLTAATSGAVILFFGYIENYTWSTACGLWTLAFLAEYVQTGRKLAAAVACGILATLFHVVAAPFVAVVAAVVLLRYGKFGKAVPAITPCRLMLAAIAGSTVIALVVQLAGVKYLLVPLWPMTGNAYWSLSPDHLLDLVNHMLLMAPLGMVSLLVTLPGAKGRPMTPVEEVLALSALFTFLAAFWIDPLLGVVRDWDLLSLYGFPLTLWGAYRFTRLAHDGEIGPAWLTAAIVVALVCLTPNIIEKNHPARGLDRLDRLISKDMHYQPAYDEGFRGVSWGAILNDRQKRPDLAEKYFKRRVGVAPGSAETWFNLGNLYLQRMVFDSAAACYRKAADAYPDYANAWCYLARAEVGMGRLDDARLHAEYAVMLDSQSAMAQTSLGVVLTVQQKYDQATSHLRLAVSLEPSLYPANMSLGIAFLRQRGFDSAYYYLKKSFDLNGGKIQDYEPLIQAALGAGRFDEAARLVARYERLAPGAPLINDYKKIIIDRKLP